MREEDVHAVSTVRITGWQAAYTDLVPQDYLDALTIEEDARTRRDMFARGDGSVLNLVAEEVEEAEDGVVVGWAALGPSREEDREPGDGELLALYAAPDRIGAGVGKALILQTLAAARERPYSRLVLWVIAANARARDFYERGGFVADGVSAQWPVNGTTVHEVRYSRKLTL
ncbi:GNAT family N-acetyltransferase [Streptomyces microflavus]|uniref:GNAT family N-acetyltransferase n=1 Tax=Streptomyces microflavus TaxID=1919 RepID=UPI00380EEEA7